MWRWGAAALVVVSSAAVLVLEVVSARLVAPYVGLTLETYTAAIGVALAAIALGSWAGGTLADRFDPRRLLGPALALAGAFVFATRPIVSALGPHVGAGPESVVVLLVLAVAAPATLLSAVPPSVVKLSLRRLDETGATVGRLSALGTLGALAGTFLTGFVLLATLATSRILFLVGAVLVVTGLVTSVAMHRVGGPGGVARVLALAVVGGGLLAVAPEPCEHETRYFCAVVSADPARESGRNLYLDTLRHAYVDLDDPTHLEFMYTKRIGDVLATVAPPGEPLRVLHLGGGGFTLPRYLAATRPGSRSVVLELDPEIVTLGRRELGLRTGPDLRVRVGDARTALRDEPLRAYDVVVGDAFGSLSVPWHLTTRELVGEIRDRLRPGGVYVLNLIDYPPLRFARAETATLLDVFDTVALIGPPGLQEGTTGGNVILVASDAGLPVVQLSRRAASRGDVVSDARAFAGDAQVLTDDEAPVDQLLTPYFAR